MRIIGDEIKGHNVKKKRCSDILSHDGHVINPAFQMFKMVDAMEVDVVVIGAGISGVCKLGV